MHSYDDFLEPPPPPEKNGIHFINWAAPQAAQLMSCSIAERVQWPNVRLTTPGIFIEAEYGFCSFRIFPLL